MLWYNDYECVGLYISRFLSSVSIYLFFTGKGDKSASLYVTRSAVRKATAWPRTSASVTLATWVRTALPSVTVTAIACVKVWRNVIPASTVSTIPRLVEIGLPWLHLIFRQDKVIYK